MASPLSKSHPFFDTIQLNVVPPSAAGKKLLTDRAFQRDHRLVVESIATHAGLIINRRCYRPYRVKDGVRTMYDPAPIPIVEGHQPVTLDEKFDCRGIGTIEYAEYIDTRRGRPEDTVVTKWSGDGHINSLGHIRTYGYIQDGDAIPRVIDKRLNRQSVGFYTDEMRDSITGLDLYTLDVEEWPEHILNWKESVDGKPVYLIPGQLWYYHLAFTDEPADPWAGVDAFKLESNQVQETFGVLRFHAQDSADGLLYDMSNPNAAKHFRHPVWAGTDFEKRRRECVDQARKQRFEAQKASLTGAEPSEGMAADAEDEVATGDCPDGGSKIGTTTDSEADATVQSSPNVDQHGSTGSDSEESPQSQGEDSEMEELLKMIREMKGMSVDQVINKVIAELGLTQDQIRALEPVKAILTADSEAATAEREEAVKIAREEIKSELDKVQSDLQKAQDALKQIETERHQSLVDRLFSIQKENGVYTAAETDSDEKIKAIKEDLGKKSADSLQFAIDQIERLRGTTRNTVDTVSRTITPNQENRENADNPTLPTFLRTRKSRLG